jgi:APA family basic amino acid/polyamine antiporter
LTAFVAVAAGVLVLRRTRPEVHRPFRTPFVPLVPLGAILVCGAMMIGLPAATWVRFALWLAAGVVLYFAYGRRRKRPEAP